MQWEITYVTAGTNNVKAMIDQANKLGAEGWEPVGITAADKTIGLNSVTVVFKTATHPATPTRHVPTSGMLPDKRAVVGPHPDGSCHSGGI